MTNKLNQNPMADHIIESFFIYRSALKSLLNAGEMSLGHYQILKELAKNKTMSMGEISNGLAISRPNLTSLIDRLVSLKQIVRKASSKDRRVIVVELTEQGYDALKKESRIIEEGISAFTSKISGGEKEEFESALNTIARVFSR